MAQYPIPQFIESEGKIISFLTFRQFFIVVGGGAFCLFFYYVFPFSLFLILSIIVIIIVGVVAFLKIDNASVVTILLNFFTFSTQSKNYVWQKKEMPYPFRAKRSREAENVREFGITQAQKSNLDKVKGMVELRKK